MSAPRRLAPVDQDDQLPPMAHPRVAAGVLFFDEADRVLLVRPSYKPGWDIPGGYVEPGESPKQACVREVNEELGITPPIGRLLVVDWAPHPDEGDKMLFVFDGGVLAAEHQSHILPIPVRSPSGGSSQPSLLRS